MTKAVEKRSTGFVTVASNNPTDLKLHVDRFEEEVELTQAGQRTVKRAYPVEGSEFTVIGTHKPWDGARKVDFVAGYALTRGIPAETWDAWLEQNQNTALVKNGVLFAYQNDADIRSAARDNKGNRSGLHGLDMSRPGKSDPRVPKKIEKGDRNKDGDDDDIAEMAA